MAKSEQQHKMDDAAEFGKEAEAAKAQDTAPQEAPTEQEDQDTMITLTPQEKSAAATKSVIADMVLNNFFTKAGDIVNLTSRIDTAEARRLVFLALNKTEIAMQEKGIGWKQINQRKFISALANVALLELDAEQGEVYPILYQEKGLYTVNMQRGYKGERKIRLKYSMRRNIERVEAKLIREGDVFETMYTAKGDDFVFKPKALSDGKVIGAFGFIVFSDGRVKVQEVTLKDIEKRKKASMAKMGGKLSPAWSMWEDEMILAKTLMIVCKSEPVDFGEDKLLVGAYNNTDYETADVEVLPETDDKPRIALPQTQGYKVGKSDV